MNQATTDELVKHVDAHARALVDEVRVLDERRFMLEPLIRDEEIKAGLAKKFANTYGANAYRHLVPLMAQDLVRDTARLFLDSDPRAGSLVNLYRKARAEPVFQALRERFLKIPDRWHASIAPIDGLTEEESADIRKQWQEKNRSEFEESFDKGWAVVGDVVTALEKDEVARKVKTYRNKYHAHLEMVPLGNDPGPFDVRAIGLKYDDIFGFLDNYLPPVFELIRVVTGNVYDAHGFSEVHKRYGHDMWRILAA